MVMQMLKYLHVFNGETLSTDQFLCLLPSGSSDNNLMVNYNYQMKFVIEIHYP